MKSIFKILVSALFFSVIFNSYSNAENSYIKDIALIKDDLAGTTELIKSHITDLGYSVDVLNPQTVTDDLLNQYRLTILATGSNQYACVSEEERSALISYMTVSHGKIIIEGGHLGYITAVFPYYLAFRQKVMKIDSWTADNGGDLVIGKDHAQSNLANIPNKLPQTIKINFSSNFDQDVCTNDLTSKLFYKTSLYSDNVGILVAPNLDNPQVINYFVNFASIANQDEAKNLLENSIYNLIGKPVGIGISGQTIPSEYELGQNYPNPFNPFTSIIYSLPRSGNISLTVSDALGREIVILEDGFKNAGNYEVNFDGSALSSGIYIYKLSSSQISITRKMILVK